MTSLSALLVLVIGVFTLVFVMRYEVASFSVEKGAGESAIQWSSGVRHVLDDSQRLAPCAEGCTQTVDGKWNCLRAAVDWRPVTWRRYLLNGTLAGMGFVMVDSVCNIPRGTPTMFVYVLLAMASQQTIERYLTFHSEEAQHRYMAQKMINALASGSSITPNVNASVDALRDQPEQQLVRRTAKRRAVRVAGVRPGARQEAGGGGEPAVGAEAPSAATAADGGTGAGTGTTAVARHEQAREPAREQESVEVGA